MKGGIFLNAVEKIIELQQSSGKTEKQFLLDIGLKPRLFAHWKSNMQPRPEHLKAIAEFYSLPSGYFSKEHGQPEDDPVCQMSEEKKIDRAVPSNARPILRFARIPSSLSLPKRKGIAFVDFEHWCFSLRDEFKMRPNITEWVEDIFHRASIEEILFFGDFSEPALQNEMGAIRTYTNRIIDTHNPDRHKKDFTDFIMIDHIYQTVISRPEISCFFIVTGDGHFNSVASFLKNYCQKEIGVYGVKGCMSSSLKKTASWYIELPEQSDMYLTYYKMILDNLYHLQSTNKFILPTFMKTVQAVSDRYNVADELIASALRKLLDEGYVYLEKRRRPGGFHEQINVLVPDWNKIEENRIWTNTNGVKGHMQADTQSSV